LSCSPATFHLVVVYGPLFYIGTDFGSFAGLVHFFAGMVVLDYFAFQWVAVDSSMRMVPAWQQP
jgi:hypothetical protein